MEQTNELSENEWKWTSVSEWIERIERNEWVLRNEWTIRATLWDEAEIIWSEADGSIYYTTEVSFEW